MPGIERSLKVVNRLGVTLFESDEAGLKGPSGYYVSYIDRLTVPLLAASVSNYIWTPAEGTWVVTGVSSTHGVVGGSSAAVTVVVCLASVAVASGTVQLTAPLDLTLTAPRTLFGTMIATPTQFGRGDAVGLLFSGTLTGLVGNISVNIGRTS